MKRRGPDPKPARCDHQRGRLTGFLTRLRWSSLGFAAALTLAGCAYPADTRPRALDAAGVDDADDATEVAKDVGTDAADDATDGATDVGGIDAVDVATDVPRDVRADVLDAPDVATDVPRDIGADRVDAVDVATDVPRDVGADGSDAGSGGLPVGATCTTSAECQSRCCLLSFGSCFDDPGVPGFCQ